MTEIELSKKIKKKKKVKKSKKKKEIKNEKEEKDGEETSLKDEKKRKRSDSGDTMESDEKQDTHPRGERGETTSPVVKSEEKEKEDMSERKEGKEKKTILTKEERKLKKAEKKAEQERLLSKVPKTDEHGISYTKVQIKRMLKRVKRGLDPVPTEEEERERARQIKADKIQEEKELAGMLYTRETNDKRPNEDEEEQNDMDMEEDEEENDNNGEDDVEERKQETEEEDQEGPNQSHTTDNIQRPKKKARTKVVPSDYVCMACNNKNQPLHWIYDCPDKIYKPGANKLKKRLRGLHDPTSRKVFISGLPFDAKTKEVEMYFEKEMKCGKVVQCKLLQFEDTKRCKGTGFLTFESDEGAKKALKLNGTVLTLPEENKKDEKKKTSAKNNLKKQKELRLGVKKVLNRAVTPSRSPPLSLI